MPDFGDEMLSSIKTRDGVCSGVQQFLGMLIFRRDFPFLPPCWPFFLEVARVRDCHSAGICLQKCLLQRDYGNLAATSLAPALLCGATVTCRLPMQQACSCARACPDSASARCVGIQIPLPLRLSPPRDTPHRWVEARFLRAINFEHRRLMRPQAPVGMSFWVLTWALLALTHGNAVRNPVCCKKSGLPTCTSVTACRGMPSPESLAWHVTLRGTFGGGCKHVR